MTEKELKTMYDKMSLSEERLSELEKRLDGCFDHVPEDLRDEGVDELLHFDAEYKPAPRRRSPLKIALTSAAAAVVVAGGVTAAFKTGLIQTGASVTDSTPDTRTEETSEPPQDSEKHGITSADLPEYPNKGILDDGFYKLDGETFDETAANDIQNQSLQKSVLVAAMTVTDCDYEWGSGDTVYTVTIDTAYYSRMGIDPVGLSIKLLMPGRISYQYVGCPLYAKGDRFLAALRNGERFYEVSAAQTIADIITIDGVDYAAAHSRNLPVMSNLAGEDVLTYDRTVTQNPAKYYGIYALDEFGQYYAGLAEHADDPVVSSDDKVDVSMLSFYSDAEVLTEIFEPNFFGRWMLQNNESGWEFYNGICLEYYVKSDDADIFRPMNGISCGGFSMDSKAFYMLDYTSGAKLWVVWKDEPDSLYCYDGVGLRARSDYLSVYKRAYDGVVPEVFVSSGVSQFGLLKILSEYGDSICVIPSRDGLRYNENALKGTLTGTVMDVLENGSTEYAGITWKRANIERYSTANIDLPEERNWLLEKSADKLSFTLRMFNEDESWRGADVAGIVDTCRYFRVDFTKTDSGWTWEYSPLSGDPSDIDNFFSPLTDTDQYCSYMNSGEIHPEVSIEYYASENGSMTDVYAVRRLKGIFGDDTDEYDIYYRDPCTDTYTLLSYGSVLAFSADGNEGVFVGEIVDGDLRVSRYKGGIRKDTVSIGSALYNRIELIPHGDFLIVGFDDDSGGRYAVLERSSLYVVGVYQQDQLKITDNSLEVLNEYDGKYTKIELTEELQIRAVEKKARWLWDKFEIEAPAGIGYNMLVTNDGRMGKVIADPELRTYDGIMKLFSEVYTDEAAADAVSGILNVFILESGGRIFTTEGARGRNVSVWSVDFTIPEETRTDSSAVLDFTVTYVDPETDTLTDKQDHYTINAVKTADGWRLDRFYYPY